MAEVKILIKGYTNADSLNSGEEEKTACTTSLIIDDKIKAIVDPGIAGDKTIFEEALASEGLKLSDITHVFLTHSHIDHYRNVGNFESSVPVVEYWGIWSGNKVEERVDNFSSDVQIIETPGHSRDGLTFLVNTDQGKVAICGDVFWKENHPAEDPYASDMDKLRKSRKKILEIADFIVPGHADVFEVKDD